MTRDEQTTKALSKLLPQGQYSQRELELASGGFTTGAKWADANPNWHKWPDEKPENGEWVFVCHSDKSVSPNRWSIEFDEWVNADDEVIIAWLDAPQPPKFD